MQSQADQALYQAKNSGRNRVCCAEHEADTLEKLEALLPWNVELD